MQLLQRYEAALCCRPHNPWHSFQRYELLSLARRGEENLARFSNMTKAPSVLC